MADLTKELALRMPLNLGASISGIATKDTLKGPDTADLEYVLPGARSAIVFCVPFDQNLIEPFLGKEGFELNENKIRTTTFAGGIAFEISTVLTSLGYKAYPVAPNFAFRKGSPNGIFDRIPPISLKFLARAAGIGHIAQSGLLINKEHGAAFSLGAVVTDAELEPTVPLPEKDSYCDRCGICKKACIVDHINNGIVEMMLGDENIRGGNCRLPARCAYPCGGITGLHRSGEWSTWSPGRFPLPEDDEDYRTISRRYVKRYLQRNRVGAVCYNPLLAYPFEMQYTCCNCQFVCHPDIKVRKRRLEQLKKGGVIIEDAEGNKRAVSPQEAEEFLSRMSAERKELFIDE